MTVCNSPRTSGHNGYLSLQTSSTLFPHLAMGNSFWRLVVCTLALVCAVAGCTPRYQAPLTVGTNTWIGYEPLYLARALGYYDEHAIRLVELGSTSQALDALRTGSLDAAAVTLDEALLLQEEGVDIVVLWVLNISAGADTLLARPTITTLADLRGKRIGVEQSAVGAYMLDAALQEAGLGATDITIVPLPVDEHLAAWDSQAIDAVVSFDPVRQRLLGQGAVELFTSRDIPGQVVDVLIAQRSSLHSRGAALAQLVDGQQRALQYLATQPQAAWQKMAPRQGISPEGVADALSGIDLPDRQANRQLLTDTTHGLSATAQHMAQLMRERLLLESMPDTRRLIDATLAQAMPESAP